MPAWKRCRYLSYKGCMFKNTIDVIIKMDKICRNLQIRRISNCGHKSFVQPQQWIDRSGHDYFKTNLISGLINCTISASRDTKPTTQFHKKSRSWCSDESSKVNQSSGYTTNSPPSTEPEGSLPLQDWCLY
jgi:hypothetical protein